jgi:hypothetical protein
MKKILILIVLIIIAAFAFSTFNKDSSNEIDTEPASVEKDDDMNSMMMKNVNVDQGLQEIIGEQPEFTIITGGSLSDVTNGEKVRGITTTSTTAGGASVGSQDGMFAVLAVMSNLPDPTGDDFYEGWIVRRGEKFSVISTGKLEKVEGQTWVNRYLTNTDVTDHDFYVLTVEPNDGDPAPADHILEGVMKALIN